MLSLCLCSPPADVSSSADMYKSRQAAGHSMLSVLDLLASQPAAQGICDKTERVRQRSAGIHHVALSCKGAQNSAVSIACCCSCSFWRSLTLLHMSHCCASC